MELMLYQLLTNLVFSCSLSAPNFFLEDLLKIKDVFLYIKARSLLGNQV